MKKTAMYVIVRCTQAGVHAGEFVKQEGTHVTLKNARRLWKWFSRFSLTDLATEGPRQDKISENWYSMPAKEIKLLDACEIITCTAEGEKGIRAVPNANK